MSRDFNQTIIVGRVGSDIELRTTGTGKAVANFRVAVNRRVNDANVATWYRCVAWAELANICQRYLQKGARVFVSGHMEERSWLDDAGLKRFAFELVVDEVLMLTPLAVSNGVAETVE